jgi:hypothetical protein
MTLGEKSAAVPSFKLLEPEICTFSDVVDKACEGLMDQQVKYSIQQIQRMEEYLSGIEQELDNFLKSRK